MNAALRLTASDLIRTLTAAAGSTRETVLVGEEQVGFLGQTNYSDPQLRWKWTALWSEGFGATRDQAVADMIAFLERELPAHWERQAEERRRVAEIEAMSPEEREAFKRVERWATAKMLEELRYPPRPVDIANATTRYREAVEAYEAIKLAGRSQCERAA